MWGYTILSNVEILFYKSILVKFGRNFKKKMCSKSVEHLHFYTSTTPNIFKCIYQLKHICTIFIKFIKEEPFYLF